MGFNAESAVSVKDGYTVLWWEAHCLLILTRLSFLRAETQRHTKPPLSPLLRSKGLSVSLASSQMLANYKEMMGIIVPLSNCWNILEGQKYFCHSRSLKGGIIVPN